MVWFANAEGHNDRELVYVVEDGQCFLADLLVRGEERGGNLDGLASIFFAVITQSDASRPYSQSSIRICDREGQPVDLISDFGG